MTKFVPESYSTFPPRLLLEEVFGKKWQKMRPLSAHFRALERDRNGLIDLCNDLHAKREHLLALYEKALCDLKECEGRAAELQGRLNAIVRAAMPVEPEEEMLITI